MSDTRQGSAGFGKKAIGNQWWAKRSTIGRGKLFDSPETLWDACVEYFEYTDSRKWNKVDYKGSNVERVEIPTDTPYTLSGLRIFLDIDFQTWINYRSKEGYEDFFDITRKVEEIIYTQKFEGATVGVYNASIVARDLGLAEKTENKNEVTISDIDYSKLSESALNEIVNAKADKS